MFSTPLAVTRASSRAAETPGTYHSPHSSPPTGRATPQAAGHDTAALAAAALQQQLSSVSQGQPTAQEDAAAPHTGHSTAATQADNAAPAPLLQPATMTDAADTSRHTSGLLSLAELTLHASSSGGGGPADQAQPQSPSSPSAVSSTSSDTAMPAAAAADDAGAAAAADVPDTSSSSSSALATAAGSPRADAGGSSSRLSPPCSPIKTQHSSGGLDRAPSWQLQHAAAAAAGTAAQPAPPRSDMDLAKLRCACV